MADLSLQLHLKLDLKGRAGASGHEISDLERHSSGSLPYLHDSTDFDHFSSRSWIYLIHTMVAPVADEFGIGIQGPSPSALTLQQAATELTRTCVLPNSQAPSDSRAHSPQHRNRSSSEES